MKSLGFTAAFGTALLLLVSVVDAKHDNAHARAVSRRHKHHHQVLHTSRAENGDEVAFGVQRRGGQCQFPSDAGLVAVTPGAQNAGWAMSPDQPCEPGHYCPYACPPGQVMAQWDPDATSYTYPQSMNGGLFCDNDGSIKKPFPNKPYCVDGTGAMKCTNKASAAVAWCQTVLPGNEAMLIPTSIESVAELAVPGPDYWLSTAAHFYINPPGVSTEEGCVWGSTSNPWGNWSPYVAGGNTDKTGNTFVKLAWNPIYLEPATPFRNQMPTWGVEIICEGGGCNGLPCAIDPSTHNVNEISAGGTIGVGGASFCVVTVPKGSKANFVVFEGSNSGASSSGTAESSSGSSSPPSPPAAPASSSAKPAAPSSSSAPPIPSSSSSSAPSSPSSSVASLTSSSSTSAPSSSSSSSSPLVSASATSESSSDQTTSLTTTTTDVALSTDNTTTDTSSSSSTTLAYSPHILVENSTATGSSSSSSISVQSTQSSAPSVTASSTTTTNSKSAAQAIGGSALSSCLSLVLVLLALGL